MKIRAGFVSNSSSSSFVCEICNDSRTGWDWNNHCADKVTCQNDHVFCVDHMNPEIYNSKEFGSYHDKDEKLPSYMCPVCAASFKSVAKFENVLFYLLKKYDLSYTDILDEIGILFKSEEEFKNYIKR